MGKHISASILANTWHEESRTRRIEAEWAVHLHYRVRYGFLHVGHRKCLTSDMHWYLGAVYATSMGFYTVSCNDVERVPGQ